MIFDVGANYGEWLAYALRFNPDAELHCFEAISSYCEKIKKDVGDRTITVNNVAVSSNVGVRKFYAFPEGSGGSSLYEQPLVGDSISNSLTEIEVPAVSLDHYCRENGIEAIDFMKIDAEGAEMEILEGARDLFLEKRIGIATIEYGAAWIEARKFLKDVFVFSNSFGYTMYKLLQKKVRKFPVYDMKQDNFHLQTWAIVSPKMCALLDS